MTTAADDRSLIAELRRACLRANSFFGTDQGPQPPHSEFSEIVAPVVDQLRYHPELGKTQSYFFGQKQLLVAPEYQGANLVRVATRRGPEEALVWYQKLLSTDRADLRFSLEVHGLKAERELRLSNNMTIHPLGSIPPSANGRALQARFQASPDIGGPPIIHNPVICTTEVSGVVARTDYEKSSRDRRTRTAAETLRKTALAFTLVSEAAPVPGVSWTDFVDPDLAEAEFGRMWLVASYEGIVGMAAPTPVDDEAMLWIDRYLRLKSHLKKVSDIAIQRLNQARRRRSAGDKAIDGAICLEAILGDRNATTEITYKLRLRAALLLANEYEERNNIRNCINEFYRLRSRTVHGTGDEFNSSDEKIAADGLAICARALQTVVRLNEDLEPSRWELQGGISSPGRTG